MHYGGQVQCLLCGRGMALARPPTAEESATEAAARQAENQFAKVLRAKTKRRREAKAKREGQAA